jgi:hypothetical protein
MKSKARTLIGKQESNRINARLQPAIQNLISGKDDVSGDALTSSETKRYVRDIKNAIDIGMISRTNARVKSALAAAMK